MGLRDITFSCEYRTMKQNIVKEFYEPALSNAISYKRAVGFFTSTALAELSKGLQSLMENGGYVQLVASPKLQEEDMKAIQYGYESREQIISNVLLRELKEPENPFQEKRLNLLANYIMEGRLDIKIVYIHAGNQMGIYHEKLGLIEDGENTVAFTGSMNESETAYFHNYEAIDVYCDWKENDMERVRRKKEAFLSIWENKEEGIEVLPFPEAVKKRLETYYKEPVPAKLETDEFLEEEEREKPTRKEEIPQIPAGFEIRDYQSQAVEMWKENGYQGIYDMATGTGKTYTALLSILRLYEEKKGRLALVIVCPYQHLVEQWVEDLQYFHIRPLIGYSQSVHKDTYKRRLKKLVFDYEIGTVDFFCFICTNATFVSASVQESLSRLKGDSLLVIDEVHNAGTAEVRKCLSEQYPYRLGLSATINRHGDEEGTKAIYDYFKKVCIRYDMETAIREHMLTPYRYYPIVVCLNEAELDMYKEISSKMRECVMTDKKGNIKLNKEGEYLAIKRARLVAAAAGKVSALGKIIEEKYRTDTHMLVYCGAANMTEKNGVYGELPEEQRQIDVITCMLGNDYDMRVAQFTSRENQKERKERIEAFTEGELQALIAIKCLDEGVNIPKIKTAFILASTTNPKEYIQRRGRVLRLAKGKEEAVIYDFVTLPRPIKQVISLPEEEITYDRSLVRNELIRMKEFKRLSKNPYDSDFLINEMEEAYGLYKIEERAW